jgi:hypothetical protein
MTIVLSRAEYSSQERAGHKAELPLKFGEKPMGVVALGRLRGNIVARLAIS